MGNQELMQLDARIAHYRFLQREVIDSPASCLLDSVIAELESERTVVAARPGAGDGSHREARWPHCSGLQPPASAPGVTNFR